METAKENQNFKPQLLANDCNHLEITKPSSATDFVYELEKKRFVATNGNLIKSESFENASGDFQAFPTHTAMLSNVCNISLPVSSTSARIAEMIKTESFITSQFGAKNKRNRCKTNGMLMEQPLGNNGVFEGEKLQYEENKQSEVLKAAKSLFSKRTRTLYHWMCPNASKHQLKMAIANSWETLSVEEKEFYISQVLGRFGFPQRSLMVNPQLGCMSNLSQLPTFPADADANLQTPDETSSAVSSILNENNNNKTVGNQIEITHADGGVKKRKIYHRTPSSSNRRGRCNNNNNNNNSNKSKSETNKLGEVVVGNGDEFQDDPELSREFQQFKWALRMSGEGK